jgi:hypothetical protein
MHVCSSRGIEARSGLAWKADPRHPFGAVGDDAAARAANGAWLQQSPLFDPEG